VSSGKTIEPEDAIIDVRELGKSYGTWSLTGRQELVALRGVSLQARAGEVFGLLGPNGAGKTTLIKILLGVVKPSSGAASLFGEPVGSTAARKRVGYLPESLRVDRHHTARSALRYYGQLSRMSSHDIARRSDELLDLVGLRGRDRESVRRFSKGMYQRLGLAQALMHNPDLLVLDEPTDGLDPVGRSEVRKVIERLRDSGKTIFLNSHILHEVEMICTRVAILANGEIRGTGRIDELSGGTQAESVSFQVCVPNSPAGDTSGGGGGDADSLAGMFHASGVVNAQITPIDTAGCTHRITAALHEQKLIDEAVDRMRAAGISIVSLQVKRPTLEDTFMKLVDSEEETVL
jgi:ABC-2 type transport system ATP-binding protein